MTRSRLVALAVSGVLAVAALAPARAAATFPGRDGAVAWAFASTSFEVTDPSNKFDFDYTQAIIAVVPGSGRARTIVSCTHTSSPSGNSRCSRWADISYAPGGRRRAWDIAGGPNGTDNQIVVSDASDHQTYDVGRDDAQPSFSPDGRRIVFVRLRRLRDQIIVSDLHGGHPRVIATSNMIQVDPRFSPDGRSILYDDNEAVWVINAAGGRPRRLIAHALTPDWSPNGKEIAYVGARLGRLFIVRANGTDRRELPAGGVCYPPICDNIGYGGATFVVFSPDGRRLAFDGESQSGGIGNADDNLYTMSVNGRRAKLIAASPYAGDGSTTTLGISWQSLR